MLVVGIQKVCYTSKKTNREVKGTKLHLIHPENPEDDNVIGQKVEEVYLSDDVSVASISVGCNVDVVYNKFGSVVKVDVY